MIDTSGDPLTTGVDPDGISRLKLEKAGETTSLPESLDDGRDASEPPDE